MEGNTMIRLPKWFLIVLAMTLLLAVAAPVLADEVKGKIKSITASVEFVRPISQIEATRRSAVTVNW
jgi:hypothetical protein